ncbi:MAG: transglutaminase-like domain-containing protein [Myxococcales bacterium]|nr:transglutaminase-like domain-containing protein [Myxococcales bacterium]MDH3844926.1 transglutaminase-like domain-containing protein [Myxococcales bacterium]
MASGDPLVSVLQRPHVKVEDVAILIAREANPMLDEHALLRALDGLGAEALIRRGLRSTPERDGRILADLLFVELGFEGERDEYYNPQNSYLDKVMIRRKGIPISLSVLTMAVGERAGMDVEGVGFPGHFLVRVGGPEGVYQDPFNRGELLDGAGLRRLAARSLGAEMAIHPSYLEPVDCLTITIRMLANLKNAHRRQGDYARAMLACDHLVELTQAPEHRRDRGLLAHALRTYGAASEDLAAYLEARPNAKDARVISLALEEARDEANLVLH